jgi:formylmethanofuran:tetrahydromethanopterin formyltransferase
LRNLIADLPRPVCAYIYDLQALRERASSLVSALPDGVNAVLEIVLDGLSADDIHTAMRKGIDAACTTGVRAISAGNYGGKLGPYHFHLRQIMNAPSA